jgi:signal transduction histidine kinase
LVRSSLSEARRFVSGLRAESLDHQGLAAALEEIGRQLTADSPTSFALRSDGRARGLPEGVEQALFRIGQEAITNAVRHARARRVEVELAFSRRDVRLTVGDDGVGFDPEAEHAGFGLRGLRERAQELGGRVEIESRPGHGTTLSLAVRA